LYISLYPVAVMYIAKRGDSMDGRWQKHLFTLIIFSMYRLRLALLLNVLISAFGDGLRSPGVVCFSPCTKGLVSRVINSSLLAQFTFWPRR